MSFSKSTEIFLTDLINEYSNALGTDDVAEEENLIEQTGDA